MRNSTQHHHNRFTALFRDHLGEPAPEEKLLDFVVQGKINRGRPHQLSSWAPLRLD